MPKIPGPVRARDLRANIAELGFERGVVATLEGHLDEFVSFRQDVLNMARIQNDLIDAHLQLSQIISRVQGGLDELKKNEVERLDKQFKDIRDKS